MNNNRQPKVRVNVFGVPVDPVDMPTAVEAVLAAARRDRSCYFCLAGAHGVVEAHRNSRIADAYRGAALVFPDGMPTVWLGRLQGFRAMDRVFGPELMLRVFEASQESGQTHFLLGGRPGIAEELAANLTRQFPAARIVGTYTPPFRDLTQSEQTQLAALLRNCNPDIIWLGISTPKQDLFMQEFCGRLPGRVMVGVGAAYDFHTGRLRDSPRWVKRAGLQWLHRLSQEPRRLWWRYLKTNSFFLLFALLALLRIKKFPLSEQRHATGRDIGLHVAKP